VPQRTIEDRRFPSWISDPIPGFNADDAPQAFKYHGKCRTSDKVKGEFQVVPMLTALFWEVEHNTIYKPSPRLKGIARS